MKVGLGQIYIEDNNPEGNFLKAEQCIQKLSSEGADLIVLPEFLLGSPAQEDEAMFIDTQDHVYLGRFQKLAKEYKVNIVPGTLASRPSRSGNIDDDDASTNVTKQPLVNVAYWIDRNGDILGQYQKKNLWHSERPIFEKGLLPHDVFETEFGRTGLLVCWDVMFPEAFKQLSQQSIDLLIIPSYWLSGDGGEAGLAHNKDCEALFLKTSITTRAFETAACIVYVNAGGPESKGFIGCSQVALPLVGIKDGVLLEAEDDAKVVDVGEGWKDVIKDAESVYKVRDDMRRADWHY